MISFVEYSGEPEIDYISPPFGYNLDPFQPLVITILFSESVQFNGLDLTAWVQSQNALYLYPVDSPNTHIFPTESHFLNDHTTVQSTFSPPNYFGLGKTYR